MSLTGLSDNARRCWSQWLGQHDYRCDHGHHRCFAGHPGEQQRDRIPITMAISPGRQHLPVANQNADNTGQSSTSSTGAVMATLASLSKPAGLQCLAMMG